MSKKNVTFSFPEELYNKMKKHKEVNWSAVVRNAVKEYLNKLELEKKSITSEDLLMELRDLGFDIREISFDEAVEFYKKMREEEWKRTFMTPTS